VRFLVDQPISWQVAEHLTATGHDALHVRDLGLDAAEDLSILERAAQEDRIIITQDTDFGTLLMTAGRSRPSVILFRMRDGRPKSQIAILDQHLPQLDANLTSGAIVVIGDSSIRVRKLG